MSGIRPTRFSIKEFSWMHLTVFSLLFAVIGGYFVYQSFAAETPVSCTKTISPDANVASEFNSMAAGQTLCLRTGTYGSSATHTYLSKSGTVGNPITLTTYPGDSPATIEGQFLIYAGDNVPVNHVTISHLNFKSNNTEHTRSNQNIGCTAKGVSGIVFWSASNIIFEYNDVSQASVPPELRETAIGINYNPTLTDNVTIRYNKIHDFGACSNLDHGIYTGNSKNGKIHGNWIYNGGCSYSTRNVINGVRNFDKGCGSGIQLYNNTDNFDVYSNVIDGTGVGLYLSDTNNDVYNNVITNLRGIFYNAGGYGAPVASSEIEGNSTNQFRDNNYFNAGAMCDNCTSTKSGNITSDPLFTNPAVREYTLKSGSPVAGFGLWNGDLSNGTQTPPPDTTPPEATWDIPVAGATVSGKLDEVSPPNCQATATDDISGVEKVEFFLDGNLTNTDSSAPYSCTIDTIRFSNGSHTLGAKAYDKAGNPSSTATRTVTFNNTMPQINLALNKPATASSVESASYSAANAVDGNNATRWASAYGDSQSIQVDLGGTYAINRVKLNWEFAYGKSYQLQVSNDGTNWTNIYSTTTSDGGIDDLTGLAGSGRYLRMNGTVRGTPYGYSLWEVEVYGTSSNGSSSFSLPPAADTWVNKKQTTRNYGTSTLLNADNSPDQDTLLKFNVSGIGSKTVKSAKLRLYVTDSSSNGGAVYRLLNHAWSENSVNWNTAPVADSAAIAQLGSVTAGRYIEVNILSLINGDGTYGMKISTPSSDIVSFNSKEAGSNRPQLVIVAE